MAPRVNGSCWDETMGDRILVLVRHGESEWNKKNLFTGWRDVDLTEKGIAEARAAGRRLKAQGLAFRCRLHLGAHSRAALARPDARGAGPAEHSGDQGPGAQRARLRRSLRPQQGRRARANGATSRCMSGGAPTTSRRPAAKASRTPPRACCPITSRTFCRASCAATTCSSPRTAIRCARWSWCSSACRRRRSSRARSRPGVPLIYRLNADSTVAEKRVLAG